MDEKVIGHVSLIKRERGWYETQIVIGEKEYWDKGYATKAINFLLDKARKSKISKIFLEVRPTNVAAIRVYQKCGFVEKATTIYPDNKSLPETIRMELVHAN